MHGATIKVRTNLRTWRPHVSAETKNINTHSL